MRCCACLVFLCISLAVIEGQSLPLLLVVSFDGFRHDYPTLHGPLRNFRRLEQRGVHALNMIPSFTTATFPNHYTYVDGDEIDLQPSTVVLLFRLMTGLYEEVHAAHEL